MDSLTHLVLGAAIGEAVLGKKIGRKAMLCGALANTVPDFDVFAASCCSDAQQLLVHRGITHSFFFVFIMSIILGWLFNKWFRKSNVGMKAWFWLFFLGLLTHILLDAFTAYGTGWFEPFSSYRVSFNTIFVADPFYTLPFLICVLVALIAKNGSAKRVKWNKTGLYISSAYLLFTIFNHWHVNRLMSDSFKEKKLLADNFTVTPTPLNNFLWMAYTHDNTGTYIGYYSIFDRTKNIDYYHIERKEALLKPYEKDESIKLLKQFSKGNYVMVQHDSSIFFDDIRFGQMGGWNGPDSTFVFSFKINKNSENGAALNRSRFKTSFSDAFANLIERIKGKD